jgi:hypothetical protein
MTPSAAHTSEPRYCDHYGNLSYRDFLTQVANGTLDNYDISTRTDV